MEKSKSLISKPLVILLVVLGLLILAAFIYLLIEIWHVFGFWRLVWTGAVVFIGTIVFTQVLGSGRKEKEGIVIYNPQEWPKFLSVIVSLSIGYYLYNHISNNQELTDNDFTFGLFYLLIFTFIPIFYTIYKLLRDRNDFIKISNEDLSYRDNATKESFSFEEIVNASISGKGIQLTFKDLSNHTIPTSQMNFNGRDLLGSLGEINSRISETNKELFKTSTEKTDTEEKKDESSL